MLYRYKAKVEPELAGCNVVTGIVVADTEYQAFGMVCHSYNGLIRQSLDIKELNLENGICQIATDRDIGGPD